LRTLSEVDEGDTKPKTVRVQDSALRQRAPELAQSGVTAVGPHVIACFNLEPIDACEELRGSCRQGIDQSGLPARGLDENERRSSERQGQSAVRRDENVGGQADVRAPGDGHARH
jgi:hypothetical protein